MSTPAAPKLTLTLLGGGSGTVHSTSVDATGAPLQYQNGPTRNLRLVAFDGGAWNEALCESAELAMQQEANQVLSGVNTLAGHASTLASLIPALSTPAVVEAIGSASTLLNQKITLQNALPVLATILADCGVIPAAAAAALPAVIAAIGKVI